MVWDGMVRDGFESVQKESPKQSHPKVSRMQMFFKKGDPRNFAIFTAKHLRWSFFLNKVSGLTNRNFI